MEHRNNLSKTRSNLPDSAGRDLTSASTATLKPALKMRQRPKLHDKKLKRGLKSRDSALCGVNIGTTKRKRPKIAYSRLAACRSKFKGHVIQTQKKQRRSPEQTASMAKGMAELHLPFLTAAESCSLSTFE